MSHMIELCIVRNRKLLDSIGKMDGGVAGSSPFLRYSCCLGLGPTRSPARPTGPLERLSPVEESAGLSLTSTPD
ncbi:hypothetical protein SKAU_G00322290 [Synaphobranchus kaupii]|uniref:Uncharacterized protein n=1 Tax=Synaphobranchus kaupii TaxID=118154 RepID=A0A9Q1IJW8_SYNKA|nr:hypothetical protein SKAU_G00322290 [Synaphobranchus kaupii]